MGKILGAAKENMGIVAGGVAGVFLAGILVNVVNSATSSVLGTSGAKWSGAVAGGVVAVGSFYAASRMRKPDMMVAFGAVALAHGIQGVLGAIGATTSS